MAKEEHLALVCTCGKLRQALLYSTTPSLSRHLTSSKYFGQVSLQDAAHPAQFQDNRCLSL